jgi:hypothetical protein
MNHGFIQKTKKETLIFRFFWSDLDSGFLNYYSDGFDVFKAIDCNGIDRQNKNMYKFHNFLKDDERAKAELVNFMAILHEYVNSPYTADTKIKFKF